LVGASTLAQSADPSSTRLLLTVDGGYGPLAGVRALHAAGYETWIAASEPRTYVERSRAAAGTVQVAPPSAGAERHAREVAETAERLSVAAVLPGTEASLGALTGRESLFPPDVTIAVTSPEVLRRATDKQLLGELARRVGLEAPQAITLIGGEEPELGELSLPAVVKPVRTVDRDGNGELRRREATLVRTTDELRAALEAMPGVRCLLQPHISGTLGAICGVAWNGELLCSMHQRSPRIWPPDRGISSYAITSPPDPSREEAVRQMIRAIGWSGVFGVQFLFAGERAYVIDFNPRLYGSLALATASGLNLPGIWAGLVLGRPAPPSDGYRVGIRYRAEEDDPRALLVAFRRGERRSALLGLIPRRHTVHAVFSLHDPSPSLVSLGKLGRARRSTGSER
jgi:carbamoylphosphate synthase large subunit